MTHRRIMTIGLAAALGSSAFPATAQTTPARDASFTLGLRAIQSQTRGLKAQQDEKKARNNPVTRNKVLICHAEKTDARLPSYTHIYEVRMFSDNSLGLIYEFQGDFGAAPVRYGLRGRTISAKPLAGQFEVALSYDSGVLGTFEVGSISVDRQRERAELKLVRKGISVIFEDCRVEDRGF